MYIYIILAECFWLIIAGFKKKYYGKTLYFNTRVYHILFTEVTTDYVASEDFDDIDLILV